MAPRRGDPSRKSSSPARFGVSQGTVRKAIDALAADNLVVRRQGKGTFVATHTEERASMFRFLRIRRNDGDDEYPASRLIDVARGKAGAGGRAPARAASRAIRCSCSGACSNTRGEPVVLDEITLPAALFRGLTKARVRRLPRLDVQLLRDAVRRADAEGAGEAARRRRRCGERARSSACGGRAAARGRSRHADLRRPARSKCGAACARRARITTSTNSAERRFAARHVVTRLDARLAPRAPVRL